MISTSLTNNTKGSFGRLRWHYIFAALVSIALSLWCAYAVAVPNPDAVIYLRSAELFAAGEISRGLAMFKWPLYSMLIAGAMTVTGANAFLAAQIVNGLFAVGTTLAFISLAYELSRGDRVVVTIATVMILFQPQLTDFRPFVIRDHGYYMLLVTSIYFCVYYENSKNTAAIYLSLLLSFISIAFRIEGVTIFTLLCGYYIFTNDTTPYKRIMYLIGLSVVSLAGGLAVFEWWYAGPSGSWLQGLGVGNPEAPFITDLYARIDNLKQVLGGATKWQAYAGIVIAIVASQMLRALTPVYAVFGFFALYPTRLVDRRALLPILWFSLGQVPMLVGFAFIKGFIPWRYGMGFALMAMFLTIYCAAAIWREFLMARLRSFFILPALVIAVTVNWVVDVPQPGRLASFVDAAQWIRANVSESAMLWTNDDRIAYLAGKDYRKITGIGHASWRENSVDRKAIDFVVVASEGDYAMGESPFAPNELEFITSFVDKHTIRVTIYKVRQSPI